MLYNNQEGVISGFFLMQYMFVGYLCGSLKDMICFSAGGSLLGKGDVGIASIFIKEGTVVPESLTIDYRFLDVSGADAGFADVSVAVHGVSAYSGLYSAIPNVY